MGDYGREVGVCRAGVRAMVELVEKDVSGDESIDLLVAAADREVRATKAFSH